MNTPLGWTVLTLYSDQEDGVADGIQTFAEADDWARDGLLAGPTATDALILDHRQHVHAHYRKRTLKVVR
jgi:hypothetical protein